MALDFSRRAAIPEMMDAQDVDLETFRGCLVDLAKVNRLTLAYRPTLAFLDRIHASGLWPKDRPVVILDVGSGYGDMLRLVRRWAKARSLDVRLQGLDRNPFAGRVAERVLGSEGIQWIDEDLFGHQGGADIIISSLFAHRRCRRRRRPQHCCGVPPLATRCHLSIQHPLVQRHLADVAVGLNQVFNGHQSTSHAIHKPPEKMPQWQRLHLLHQRVTREQGTALCRCVRGTRHGHHAQPQQRFTKNALQLAQRDLVLRGDAAAGHHNDKRRHAMRRKLCNARYFTVHRARAARRVAQAGRVYDAEGLLIKAVVAEGRGLCHGAHGGCGRKLLVQLARQCVGGGGLARARDAHHHNHAAGWVGCLAARKAVVV